MHHRLTHWHCMKKYLRMIQFDPVLYLIPRFWYIKYSIFTLAVATKIRKKEFKVVVVLLTIIWIMSILIEFRYFWLIMIVNWWSRFARIAQISYFNVAFQCTEDFSISLFLHDFGSLFSSFFLACSGLWHQASCMHFWLNFSACHYIYCLVYCLFSVQWLLWL